MGLKQHFKESEPDVCVLDDLTSLYPSTIDRPTAALDMDGTLAKSKARVFKCIGEDVTYDDIETWDWPIEEFGAARFLGGFTTAWGQQWQHIDPWEADLAETVWQMGRVFDVDVVTHQPDDEAILDGKKSWLDAHNIEYEELVGVPFDTSKAELGYDVYIDDKPHLPKEVAEACPDETMMYLIDQPYNRDAPGEYVRVNTVREALNHLIWGVTDPNVF